MSDDKVYSNGTVRLGLKELLTFGSLVGTFIFSWAMLQAKSQELEKSDALLGTRIVSVETASDAKLGTISAKVDADHDTLKEVQSDVAHVREDVQQIKMEQAKARESIQKQEIATAQILEAIQALKPKPR